MNPCRLFGPGLREGHALPSQPPGALPRTALLVSGGNPRHLGSHLHRLETGAAAMGQAAGWLGDLTPELTAWLALAAPDGKAALRLVLHPYAGLLEGRLEPLPVPVEPYLLVPRPHPLAGRRGDPILAHKGLAGPWGAEILASAQHLGAADALLLWSDGTLAETAIAAVGLERDGVFTLPPPPGRVASLAVQLDLPVWAAARGLRIAEAALTPAQALAGRLWCMNALRGIWPATLL